MSRHPPRRLLTAGRPTPGGGRVLTHTNVWSPDGAWLVYDTRSDPAGTHFDGTRIERVHARTGAVETLYTAANGAHCGVATHNPDTGCVLFILGPESPDTAWSYGPARRQGVILDGYSVTNLDARDLTPPFTPGALRGGSHVHVAHPAGRLVSFTYDDHVLTELPPGTPDADSNQRNVAVADWGHAVGVPATHPRDHDGESFSVVVTRTVNAPTPGSDEISRACEEAWVGGSRTLAFQGTVVTADGATITEAFAVDLPDDLTAPGGGPLEGTATRRPAPPRGTVQRRLTDTTGHRYPGLSGPRHWLRSDGLGRRVGVLKRDSDGVVQFWTVSPVGGDLRQVTRSRQPVASAFTWHPDGERVAFVAGDCVCLTDVTTGVTTRLTPPLPGVRPEACVVSPDGAWVAFVQSVGGASQVGVVGTS